MKQAMVIMGLFFAQVLAVAHGGPVLTGYGSCRVDGIMDPGEWDNAAKHDLVMKYRDGSTATTATLYVMNDGASLCVAAKVAVPTSNRGGLVLRFDNDHNDRRGNNDDLIAVTTGYDPRPQFVKFHDQFHATLEDCPRQDIPGACAYEDVKYGGSENGPGKAVDDGPFKMYEMIHPLRSGDVRDFHVWPGDVLGFDAELWFCTNGDALCARATIDSGDIIIARPGPAINVLPEKIVFPETLRYNTSEMSGIVVNSGTATLMMSKVSATHPFTFVGSPPASLPPGGMASFRVIFSPDGPGPYVGAITITSNAPTSPTRVVLNGSVAKDAAPTIAAVVSAGNFFPETAIAPGSIVTIFGTGFGSRDNLSAFPATEVDGLSVTFNNLKAPLFHVIASKNQLNVLVPSELSVSGVVAVQVHNSGGVSTPLNLRLATAAPALFVIRDPTITDRFVTYAASLLGRTAWLPIPRAMAEALHIPNRCRGVVSPATICGEPARSGEFIQVYATGLGRATPGGDPAGRTLPSGEVAPANGVPLYETIQKPLVSVGGVDATVLFSGLAPGFAGLYQVNIRLPENVQTGEETQVVVTVPYIGSVAALIAIE